MINSDLYDYLDSARGAVDSLVYEVEQIVSSAVGPIEDAMDALENEDDEDKANNPVLQWYEDNFPEVIGVGLSDPEIVLVMGVRLVDYYKDNS